jgi:hypothetical protein
MSAIRNKVSKNKPIGLNCGADKLFLGKCLAGLVVQTPALVIALVILAGCADPAAEQAARERDDARLRVLGDAMFYWQCTHRPVQLAGECNRWRQAYDEDRAAFNAKYGDPTALP